jgi:hypothetical protein
MRSLALPFLIALMLHILVLSQFGKHPRYEETTVSPTLTIRLMAEAVPAAVVRKSRHATRPAPKRIANTLTSDSSDAQLDMNLIRGQARSYARESLADNEPALSIEGDYYGSFSGDDSGVFYVHLYANGHASGTGQSNSINIPFLISGNVDKEGMIAMQGSGIAGDARFTGQLNIATGTVSGSWNVPGFMKGIFSAHREELRSAQAGF